MTLKPHSYTWTVQGPEPALSHFRQLLAPAGQESALPTDVLILIGESAKADQRTLRSARQQNPGLVTVVAHGPDTISAGVECLNLDLVDFFTSHRPDPGEWNTLWDQVLAAVEKNRSQRQWLRSAKDQNRELEQLTRDLEAVVSDRTQDAARSKVEVEARLTHFRELLRFMQDLAAISSPEELLQRLRKELKVYHRVGEPILAYGLSAGTRRLVYLRSGQVFERRAVGAWPQSLRLRRNESVDSHYLANEFGRPVQPVLAIPLLVRKPEATTPAPTLFLEHQLQLEEIDQFVQFVGERLQVVSIALDRLLLEFDLRSATYLWEHTFDSFEDPVAIVDTDFRLLRSNRAFQNLAGHSTCHRVFAQAETPCPGCPLLSVLTTNRSERAMVQRGATVFAVHSYPITLNEGDRPTTVVNHYVNMTDALALQERMVQTEKMVALGHLAGHIAHELNNPLTGIRALAQVWVAQSTIGERVRADLVEVESAAARSQAIIANLLQFARTEEPENIQATDLSEVVRRTLPLLKTALSEHQLEVTLPASPAWVRAEAHLVQQVLFNLLKNACQAMTEPGAIAVRVESASWRSAAAFQMVVSDSGPGIAPDLQESIFTPFFTTKTASEGTGLGLSLSRSVIRRFGGDILVTSVPGQGTEFRVLLIKETP